MLKVEVEVKALTDLSEKEWGRSFKREEADGAQGTGFQYPRC